MTDISYIYSIEDFLNNKVDIPKLDADIRASDITVSLAYINSNETECSCFFRNLLEVKDETTLSGIVSAHDGIANDVSTAQHVEIIGTSIPLPVDLFNEFRDKTGKLRVHQTSRNSGTMLVWLGEGDDPSDPALVGGGEVLTFNYKVGQTATLVKYIDFNVVENESFLHEGYISWKSANLDFIDLQIVSTVTQTTVTSGTNFNIYNDYLIVPAQPGTGTVQVTSDITTHFGGLVFMPKNDVGVRGPSFWNANWNTTTKLYENIVAAPLGDGEYNMFSNEIVLVQFVRHMSLLGDGFIALNSSDTDKLGQGMRIKMVANTNTSDGDHAWSFACLLCLHRSKSVSAPKML